MVDARRAAQIQDVLAGYPPVVAIEDDYIADIAGLPYAALHGRSDRWAVRYRTAPGIRVTTTTLLPTEARRLADDIAAVVASRPTTYAG